jgi:hypothetical protein
MATPDKQSAAHGGTESSSPDEIRDQLPADLDVTGFVGAYQFPDNSRRRIPAVIYSVVALGCLLLWLARRNDEGSLVNDGLLYVAILLGVFAAYVFTSSWRMSINEREALVRATQAVGFAVGHASAQQVWRGLRSRPTWRVFCYSAQEPPLQRGLVLVDAVDGRIVETLVEDNPRE